MNNEAVIKPFTRKMEGNGQKNVILARMARTRL
jgi:hypothetical protein